MLLPLALSLSRALQDIVEVLSGADHEERFKRLLQELRQATADLSMGGKEVGVGDRGGLQQANKHTLSAPQQTLLLCSGYARTCRCLAARSQRHRTAWPLPAACCEATPAT